MENDYLIPASQVEEVTKQDLCIGCGFCKVAINADNINSSNIKMHYDEVNTSFTPELERVQIDSKLVYCPGKKMPLRTLVENKFGPKPIGYLGHYIQTFAAWQTNKSKRFAAASGGISGAIIEHLLSTGAADRVYMAVNNGLEYNSYGAYIDNTHDLSSGYDSIYHPVDFGRDIIDLITDKSKFVFVGLPCQIAALEVLKKHDPKFKERCVLTVGLFCGGVNRFQGVDWYIRKVKKFIGLVKKIEYRDGFWPGQIKVTTNTTELTVPRIMGNSRRNILKYITAFQGPWMLKRCRICPDQVSHLADIAVGDPHLPKYKQKNSLGVSAVVVRTTRAAKVISELIDRKIIETEILSGDEIIESQGYTLKNRTHANIYVDTAISLDMASPTIEELNIHEPNLDYVKKIARFAQIDLLKIKYRNNRILLGVLSPIQIIEYLFVRFTPKEFVRKATSIVRNKK